MGGNGWLGLANYHPKNPYAVIAGLRKTTEYASLKLHNLPN
ncbi:hypothetical protein [Nostoc sp.]